MRAVHRPTRPIPEAPGHLLWLFLTGWASAGSSTGSATAIGRGRPPLGAGHGLLRIVKAASWSIWAVVLCREPDTRDSRLPTVGLKAYEVSGLNIPPGADALDSGISCRVVGWIDGGYGGHKPLLAVEFKGMKTYQSCHGRKARTRRAVPLSALLSMGAGSTKTTEPRLSDTHLELG